jgi:serine/threonine-protein kinase RsbW
MNKKHKQLILKNDVRELNTLAVFLEQLGEKWNFPMNVLQSINLALEEAVSNIIFYAYEDREEHEIVLDFRMEANHLTITLADDGQPFDPTRREDPDTSLPLEERPIGGLGIHLIKKLMDEVSYKRTESTNQMTLLKNIS